MADHVAHSLALRPPRRHHAVLAGGDALTDRLAVVEHKLRVVGGGHRVGAVEVEEVGAAAQHALLRAGASSKPEVVKAAVQKKEVVLVHCCLKTLRNHVLASAAQGCNTRGIPHHGQQRLEKRAQARILLLCGNLINRHPRVHDGSLPKCLQLYRKVAIIFSNELFEHFLRKRIIRVERRHVLRVELVRFGNILHCPLFCDEVLHDVPNPIEDQPRVFLIVFPVVQLEAFSELSIRYHLLRVGVHLEVARLVRVREDRHGDPPEQNLSHRAGPNMRAESKVVERICCCLAST
mmetsp:Transcript_35825/g.60368  ORF Transcript_35825/g.60368 Transcript_35825/m.60368 type:complete len:292 (+) Transcript_35825:1454-2329(+)